MLLRSVPHPVMRVICARRRPWLCCVTPQVRVARQRAFDTQHTPSWFVFFRTQRAAAVAAQCVLHAEDNRQFRVGRDSVQGC